MEQVVLVLDNYLADNIFWQDEILFLRRKLESKENTIDKLFNILHSNNNKIIKNVFLIKTLQKTNSQKML